MISAIKVRKSYTTFGYNRSVYFLNYRWLFAYDVL